MKLKLVWLMLLAVAIAVGTGSAFGQNFEKPAVEIRRNTITVTSPGLATNLINGTMATITWKAPADVQTVSIYMLVDRGEDRDHGVEIALNVPNTGSYSWKIDRCPYEYATPVLIAITGVGTEYDGYGRPCHYIASGKGSFFTIDPPAREFISADRVFLTGGDILYNYYKVKVDRQAGTTEALGYQTEFGSFSELDHSTRISSNGSIVWNVQLLKSNSDVKFYTVPSAFQTGD